MQKGKGFQKNNFTKVYHQFSQLVNMTPEELTARLKTNEAQQVAYKEANSDESVGHVAGQKIVKMLGKDQDDLTDGECAHMERAVEYIKSHFNGRPAGDITNTSWRYMLMNWGHDPLK